MTQDRARRAQKHPEDVTIDPRCKQHPGEITATLLEQEPPKATTNLHKWRGHATKHHGLKKDEAEDYAHVHLS